MKKKLIFLSLIVFTGYILLYPKDAVAAAATGLVLWYEQILPTLLPFAILSNVLICSGYLQYLTRLTAPAIKMLFPVSDNGAFVMLSGFLFGFPMGSKNCAELLKCGQLEQKEADILFIITNNISPVFISSFILTRQLMMPERIGISYLLLYLPPLLTAGVLLARLRRHPFAQTIVKSPASRSQMNFKIIDAGIMNGFETLTRLGGYIMLFSIIASILKKLPLKSSQIAVLTGITEITNGIRLLPTAITNPDIRYVLAMGFTAFGGLSGIAQTSSMIRDTKLSLTRYLLLKLWFALCTVLLAVLFTYCCPL